MGGDEQAPEVSAGLTDPRDVERPQRAPSAVIQSTGGIDFDPAFATFGARLVGLAVDTLITVALMMPGIVVAVAGRLSLVGLLGVFLALSGFVVAGVLYARAVARTGRWVGNRVASTDVVHTVTGARLSATAAFTRFFLRSTVSPVLMFGFLMALADPQRRAFHDQLSGSIVTRAARATWTAADDDVPADAGRDTSPPPT